MPPVEGDDSAQGPRLFSAGLHGEVAEWDLSSMVVRNAADAAGGAVWAICALRHNLLVASEDGSVRAFTVGAGVDEIFQSKRIVVGPTRCLSIAAFGKDNFFVGSNDGKITKWSLSTSTCEARMLVEKSGQEETFIWSLVCLGDHGIASGDSLGVVTIWDPVMCVVLHRFVHHQADVLTLSTSMDGNVLISAGIDGAISTYCRLSNSDQWFFRNSDAGHTHDIRATALDIAANGRKQILSGSISGQLFVHALRLGAAVKKTKPQKCGGFSPCFQRAAIAEDSRLVMCQSDSHLELHYIQPPSAPMEAAPKGVAAWAGAAEVWPSRLPEPQLLVRHSLARAADGHHLTSSAITKDGRFFACSDLSGTRLFHLNISELEVRRERQFPESVLGVVARALLFCSESLLIMAGWESHRLHVVDVQKLKATATFSEHSAPVTLLASAGEWLASGDVSGRVHLYNLDSMRHQVRVPAGSSQEFPTALSFDTAGKNLIIALSTHKVLIYDIEAQTFAANLPAVIAVPAAVLPMAARICSITSLPEKLILTGHEFMLTLDLQQLALLKSKSARGEPLPDVPAPVNPRFKKKLGFKNDNLTSHGIRLHISDAKDTSPCVWRSYSKMTLRHVFGIFALDRSRWGKPVLPNHYLPPGDAVEKRLKTEAAASEEDAEGSSKRRRMDIQAMLLTIEVAPETILSALPPPFEKKKFLSSK